MSLTLAQPVATARGILNDPAAVRYSAADLLQYGNDALDQILALAPHLFNTEGNVTCLAGKTLQSVSYADAHALVAVRRIVDGPALTVVDQDTLDRYDRNWHTATPAAAIHWMPVEGAPTRFLVYPPAPANQVLDVLYTRIPAEYTINANTELPATLADAVADYIVARAESRDDEHVNTGRAAQFLASFVTKVRG